MAGRRQPSTIDTQRVTNRDQRQETKGKTASESRKYSKFNSGVNIEAVFGAISVLLETFTSQVLDATSVNMSLLLRTIYRNLDDDMVAMLSNPSNVDALNKFLQDKNQQLQQSAAQPEPQKEIQKEEVEISRKTVSDEKTEVSEETLPKIEESSVTEKENEPVVSEKVTKTEEKGESKSVEVDLSSYSPTQKLCALGEANVDEMEPLEIVNDFINEITRDAWRLGAFIQNIRQTQDSKYTEFKDEVEEDDEDKYEWNLYRYMYNKQAQAMRENRERMEELLKNRVIRRPQIVKPEPVAQTEESTSEAKTEEPVIASLGESEPQLETEESTAEEPQKPKEEKEEQDETGEKEEEAGKQKEDEEQLESVSSRIHKSVQQVLSKNAGKNLAPPIAVTAKQPEKAKPFLRRVFDGIGKALLGTKNQETPITASTVAVNTAIASRITANTHGLSATPVKSSLLGSPISKTQLKEKATKKKDALTPPATVPLKKRQVVEPPKAPAFVLSSATVPQPKKGLFGGSSSPSKLFIFNRIFVFFKSKDGKSPIAGLDGLFEQPKEGTDGKELKVEGEKEKKKEEKKPKKNVIKRVVDKVKKAFKRKPKTDFQNLQLINRSIGKSIKAADKKAKAKVVPPGTPSEKKETTEAPTTPKSAENQIDEWRASAAAWQGAANRWKDTSFFWRNQTGIWRNNASLWQRTSDSWRKSSLYWRGLVKKISDRVKKATVKPNATKEAKPNIEPKTPGFVKPDLSSIKPKQKAPGAVAAPQVAEPPSEEQEKSKKELLGGAGKTMTSALAKGAAITAASNKQDVSPSVKAIASKAPALSTSKPAPTSAIPKASASVETASKALGTSKASASTPAAPVSKTKASMPKVSGPVPKASKGKEPKSDKGMVKIPGKQVTEMQGLRKKQDKQNRGQESTANGLGSAKPSMPKGVGDKPKSKSSVTGRSKMGDDEAFSRNMREGADYLMSDLYESKAAKKALELPNNAIGKSMTNIIKATTKVAKKTDKDLSDVEDQINNPDSGWLKSIFWGFLKWGTIAFLGIGLFGVMKGKVLEWFPKDESGNYLHGPVIFGYRLPSLGDIWNGVKVGYYMIKDAVRTVYDWFVKVKRILKWDSFPHFLTWVIEWCSGFVYGKIMKMVAGVARVIADYFFPGLGDLLVDAAMLGYEIQRGLMEAIRDMLGFPNPADNGFSTPFGPMIQDMLSGITKDDKHGERAVNNLNKTAAGIKSLVPMENIMPKSMTAKGVTKGGVPRVLIPDMGFVALHKDAYEDEREAVNKASEKAKKQQVDDSVDKANSVLGKRVAGNKSVSSGKRVDSRWNPFSSAKYEDEGTAKLRDLGERDINAMKKAQQRVKKNIIDARTWTAGLYPLIPDEELIDPKTGQFNQKWSYAGGYKGKLSSVMPITPFAAIGGNNELAKPLIHPLYGYLPFSFTIPSTGAEFIADAHRWEYERLNVGISAWKSIIYGAEKYGYGTPDYNKRVANEAKKWTEISLNPNWGARYSSSEDWIKKWNEYGDLRLKIKKDKERKEKMPDPAIVDGQGKPGEQKPRAANAQKGEKTGAGTGTKVMRGIGGAALLVGTALVLTNPVAAGALAAFGALGWLKRKMTGKKEDEEKKKQGEFKPGEITAPDEYNHGYGFIAKEIVKEPFPHLVAGKKPDEIRKALKLDDWFPKPQVSEKIYQEGAGRVYFNVLNDLGFKYDKAVWQNQKYLRARGTAIAQIAKSVNDYIVNVLQPYRVRLAALFDIAGKHKTKEYQDEIKAEAQKTLDDFAEANTRKGLMKYIAKVYKPVDYHLVVRDKDGNIVKEEGNELRGFNIPKELYNENPEYWDSMMDAMNEPGMSEIARKNVTEIMNLRVDLGAKIESMGRRFKALNEERLRTAQEFKLQTQLAEWQLTLLDSSFKQINERVKRARAEIRNYFRWKRIWSSTPISLMFNAATTTFNNVKKVAKTVTSNAASAVKGIVKVGKGLAGKLSGWWKKGKKAIIAEHEKLTKRKGSFVTSLVDKAKKVGKKVTSKLQTWFNKSKKKDEEHKKEQEKAKKVNIKLFNLFHKTKADDSQLNMQAQEIAKEMVPKEDVIGQAKIRNIVKLADERKANESSEKQGMMGYWAYLKRKWQDRISEESMHELKATSLDLSNNIKDYMGMVREIPTGKLTIVNTTVHQQPKKVELLPDLAF